MNIIIDNPQLLRVVSLFLNEFYGDLTPKTHSKHPYSVYYVDSDNRIILQHNLRTSHIYVNHLELWSRIESLFSLRYDVIQSIMKHWLEEAYNLRGVTPTLQVRLLHKTLEEAYNLRGVTPVDMALIPNFKTYDFF